MAKDTKAASATDSGIDAEDTPISDTATEKHDKDGFEQWLDDYFESSFFALRYVLILPVLISLFGSFIMFGVGSFHIYEATYAIAINYDFGSTSVILKVIKGLDAFLIGIILVIFSFGIYDFFISELEPAEHAGIRPDWFKFDTTGELKTKLIELVIVVLSIKFFEEMVGNIDKITDPVTYLIIPIGAAILAISIGFFKWATH